MSACYENYVDLQADGAINISTLLLDTLGSDSGDDDPDLQERETKTDANATNRMRKIPMAFRGDAITEDDQTSDSDTTILRRPHLVCDGYQLPWAFGPVWIPSGILGGQI